MGAYDKKGFSKQYSQRTEKNYEYIKKTVNRDELIAKANEELLNEYRTVIELLENIRDEIRRDANGIANVQRNGKNALKGKMHNVASKLEDAKKKLENNLNSIIASGNIEGDKLYEVTQLINSLMGIAVLPYEMHKEYFKPVDEDKCAGENKGKKLKEIQASIRDTEPYKNLGKYIKELYENKKWYSKYETDLKNGALNESEYVFSFLKHLRNSTCHSGDNAMSILPLSEGLVIEEILFYDHYKDQEFAMRLSIKEMEELVDLVASFYRDTDIGNSDKTEQMENAENRVRELLNKARK